MNRDPYFSKRDSDGWNRRGIPKPIIELLLDNSCSHLEYVDAGFYCVWESSFLLLGDVKGALTICSTCKITSLFTRFQTTEYLKSEIGK